MEIFMYEFSVYESSSENCLENLETVFQRCQDKNLSLNWEKFYFMVTKDIVLRHKISTTGLEDDQAKVSIIETLMPPTVRPEKFKFLEKGQIRNFDYKIVNCG